VVVGMKERWIPKLPAGDLRQVWKDNIITHEMNSFFNTFATHYIESL